MNIRLPFAVGAVSAAVFLLAGCGDKADKAADTSAAPAAAPVAASSPAAGSPAATTVAFDTGKPLGTLKVGGKAVCAVCAVKEGTKAVEEVKATLDYKGKTYGFCNEGEKAEFISSPAKYAQAN